MEETAEKIRTGILKRFTTTARTPSQVKKLPLGRTSAVELGYDEHALDRLPDPVTESFCGVGNPLGLGRPAAGETVLDFGCGAGLDSILAAQDVGPSGRVVGVDMTEAMTDKARANADSLELTNIEFIQAEVGRLPLEDASVDLVISNGVFNLCQDKPAVLAELFRVLKPGGRLQMADILLHDDVTAEKVAAKGAWSD